MLEHSRLMNHCVQVVRVVQHARVLPVVWPALASWGRLGLRVLTTPCSLLGKVWRLKDLWSLEDLCLNGVRSEGNVQAPLLYVLALGNHIVEFADRADAVMWFLEQRLTHRGHGLFVLTDLLGNTNKHAQLRRQIDILPLLLDFEKGLVQTHDLLVVLLSEVLNHRNGLTGLALLEA